MARKALVLVTLLGFLLATGIAQATPQYNTQTGQPCTTCHTSSFSLTGTGKAFKAGGYKWPLPKPASSPASTPNLAPTAGKQQGTVVSTGQFKDMKGHWAEAQVTELVKKKIIVGYTDGTFRPAKKVTAGEFSALVQRALPADHPGRKNLNGYFGVKTTVNRGTAVKMALAALGVKDIEVMSFENWRNLLSFYSDRDEISSVVAPYVAWATRIEIVGGFPDGSFKAEQELSRAEAALLVAKLLKAL